jgi:hypothetical protein
MKYNYANVKFNNGNGALLCNACRTIIAYGHDHEDRLHFCESCSDVMAHHDWYLYHKVRIWKDQNKALDELAKQDQELFDDRKKKFGSNPFGEG